MTKKQEEETALIAKQDEALAQFYDEADNDDFDRMDSEDVIMPRITLLQAKSPQCESGELKPGSVLNNVTGTAVISEPATQFLTVIPIFHYNSRIRWFPMDSGEDGFQCQSEDALIGVGDPGGDCRVCEHSKFIGDTKPSCNKNINFIVMLPDFVGADRFALLSFNRTSFKVGKQILNMIRSLKGRIFTNRIELGADLQSGGKWTWWAWDLQRNKEGSMVEKLKDVDLLKEAHGMSEFMKTSRSTGNLKVQEDITESDADFDADDYD